MEFLYDVYDKFLSLFPDQTHWLVSLIVLISLFSAFFVLIRFHWIFFILLILFVPISIPILKNFFTELYEFVVHVLGIATGAT